MQRSPEHGQLTMPMTRNLALSCSAAVLGLCASTGASAQGADWQTVYFGGQIGVDINVPGQVEFGDFTPIVPQDFFPGFTFPATSQVSLGGPFSQDNTDSVIGGLLAGWNFFQSGSTVLGLEGDFSWTGADINAVANNRIVALANTASELGVFDETLELNADVVWKATIRGRAGLVTLPNLLLYLTAGIAFGELEAKQTSTLAGQFFTGPPFNFLSGAFTQINEGTDSNIHVGWSAGAGGDLKLFDNITTRFEVLYIDLGSETYEFGAAGEAEIDVQEVVARVGFTIDLN